MPLISILTDDKSLLTKKFSLNEDGTLQKSAAGHIVSGTIETLDLSAGELAKLIPTLEQNQCLCLGQLSDYSEKKPITCNKLATNNQATRSKKFLDYRTDNNFLLLEIDDTDKTPEEVLKILSTIDPQFETAAMCVVPSSSSYLYKDSGEELKGASSFHIYVELIGNPTNYGDMLFNRLLLSGYHFTHIAANGVVIVKSLFDKAVISGNEREIFSATPILEDGLVSKRIENIAVQEGEALDASLLEPISPEEELEIRQLYIKLRESVAEEAEEKREAYREIRAAKLAKAKGTSKLYELAGLQDSNVIYDKAGRPIVELLSNELLMDQDENEFYVHDIMLDPPENPVKMPDPCEPMLYGSNGRPGQGIATILSHSLIYSHAHGGINYTLRWHPQDLVDTLQSDNVSTNAKKLIWRLISTNQQQLTSTASDSEISEVADAFKRALASVNGSGVSNDKTAIKKKLTPVREVEDQEDEMALGFNSEFGVGIMTNKTVVLKETWNKSLKMYDTIIARPSELEQYYRHQQVRTAGQAGTRSSFAAWMDSPDRNTYHDVFFEPVPGLIRKPATRRVIQQGGAYNLYCGIVADFDKAIYPTKILEHLKVVWCGGKEDEYDYLIRWFATLFQKPNEVNGTAIILQSSPGAGKNIIIDNCIVRHFGPHAISTTRKDDFIGRFNKQLGLNVFLFANESVFAGDHGDKNAIKTLITDQWRTIEMKGLDSVKARNYSSLIFGSNSGWVMNIEALDRRFMYLSVSDEKCKNSQYFKDLADEINNGGSDGFVKYLMEFNLNDFDISVLPVGNIRQRNSDLIRSSTSTVRFFLSMVDFDSSCDQIFDSAYQPKAFLNWHTGKTEEMTVTREYLYSMYTAYANFFGMNRGYEDAASMQREFETSGYLAPDNTSHPEDYPIVIVSQDGQRMWRVKSRVWCQKKIFNDDRSEGGTGE